MADPILDPNHGAGGAYVINPETGLRELAERTQEAPRPGDAPEAETPAPDAEE
jgi:hypothetical protein